MVPLPGIAKYILKTEKQTIQSFNGCQLLQRDKTGWTARLPKIIAGRLTLIITTGLKQIIAARINI